MSDLNDLFNNLYNNFILRDLLAMVLPGFLVFFTFSQCSANIYLWKLDLSTSSLVELIMTFLLSYIIGVLMVGLADIVADKCNLFGTFYRTDVRQFRWNLKQFYKAVFNEKSLDAGLRNKYCNIRERLVSFTQACGNIGCASLISIIIIELHLFLQNQLGWYIQWKICPYLFLLIASLIGHYYFAKGLCQWDYFFIAESSDNLPLKENKKSKEC